MLHKNPARAQVFELTFGKAHVIYAEASSERCTAALVLEVDPIGLVRRRRGTAGDGGGLGQYVNDRPYVASSFLSVAIAEVFGSALAGRCKDRPELVETAIPHFDVPRGATSEGARLGALMRRNIAAACANVSAIWESV